MIKTNLPLVNLEGYNFKCIRCGKCCEVLVKTELSKMKMIYRYNYQGKLSKSPFTTTTVYHNEIKEITKFIDKNLETSHEFFVPFESLFLKDYPFEFVYSYQVKTNGKLCIFYDKSKRSCNIYPVRPLPCKAYPLYNDIAIMSGNFVDQPNIAKCTSVDKEIKKDIPTFEI